MEELKFSGVNIDAKALEEQNEKFKKANVTSNGSRKNSFDPKNYLDLKLKENEDYERENSSFFWKDQRVLYF